MHYWVYFPIWDWRLFFGTDRTVWTVTTSISRDQCPVIIGSQKSWLAKVWHAVFFRTMITWLVNPSVGSITSCFGISGIISSRVISIARNSDNTLSQWFFFKRGQGPRVTPLCHGDHGRHVYTMFYIWEPFWPKLHQWCIIICFEFIDMGTVKRVITDSSDKSTMTDWKWQQKIMVE